MQGVKGSPWGGCCLQGGELDPDAHTGGVKMKAEAARPLGASQRLGRRAAGTALGSPPALAHGRGGSVVLSLGAKSSQGDSAQAMTATLEQPPAWQSGNGVRAGVPGDHSPSPLPPRPPSASHCLIVSDGRAAQRGLRLPSRKPRGLGAGRAAQGPGAGSSGRRALPPFPLPPCPRMPLLSCQQPGPNTPGPTRAPCPFPGL